MGKRSAVLATTKEYAQEQWKHCEEQVSDYARGVVRGTMYYESGVALQRQLASRDMRVPDTMLELVRAVEELAEQEDSQELDDLLEVCKTRLDEFDQFKAGVEEGVQSKIDHVTHFLENLFDEDDCETQRLIETGDG